MITFHFYTFTIAELNYNTYDKKLLVFFETFKIWQHYLNVRIINNRLCFILFYFLFLFLHIVSFILESRIRVSMISQVTVTQCCHSHIVT